MLGFILLFVWFGFGFSVSFFGWFFFGGEIFVYFFLLNSVIKWALLLRKDKIPVNGMKANGKNTCQHCYE